MKTALEAELTSALKERAAALPVDASERLRSLNYYPRRHRRAAPAVFGVTAVGAATAGTVLAVALGGAAPAYAGWSTAPTASTVKSPSLWPQANQSCLGALSTKQPTGGELGSGTWQPLLTDVRGPFTVALYQNNSAYMSCFTSSSFTQVTQVSSDDGISNGVLRVSGSSSGSGSPAQGLATVTVSGTTSGDLQNIVQSHLSTTADGPYTLVDGRVASGVKGVTLVLDNGQGVVATVADGWLVAWWPNNAAATSSQVTTASGTTSETLVSSTKGPPTPPAPGSCTPTTTPDGTNGVVHCASSGGGRAGSGNSDNSGSGPNVTGAKDSANTGGTGPGPTKP
jgi:hypothetical protein